MTQPISFATASNQTAVVQSGYGPTASVLSAANDLPVRAPGAMQVQIQVRAAGVNPIDWQMIEGYRTLIAKRTFPFVPLFDIAGVVTAIGSGVTRFAIGDRVHTDNKIDGGGGGQWVNVDEDLVSAIPPDLTFAEAASIPLAGQTALLALDQADVRSGHCLCVIGASGGVGAFVVQMAKARGATVIGVCSAANAAFVTRLGADKVVDYRTTPLIAALPAASVDAIIDCVGGRAQWVAARRLLRPNGRFATISRDEDGKMTVASATKVLCGILARQLASRFGRKLQYIPVFLDASHRLLDRVDDMVRAGQVRAPIAKVYPHDRNGIVEALEESKRGRVAGKLVIAMSSDSADAR